MNQVANVYGPQEDNRPFLRNKIMHKIYRSAVHSCPAFVVARFTGLPGLHGRGKTGGGQSLERGPATSCDNWSAHGIPVEFGVIRKVPATNLARGCKGSLDVIPVHALVITSYCSAVLFIYSLFLSSLFWISIVNCQFNIWLVWSERSPARCTGSCGCRACSSASASTTTARPSWPSPGSSVPCWAELTTCPAGFQGDSRAIWGPL